MGTILYEMATAKVAFTGASLMETVVNITSGRPQPMMSYRPDTPPAFAELVDRAISLDPDRRIVTIEELRAGLKAALDGRQRVATPVGGMPAISKPQPTPPPGAKLTPIPGSSVAPPGASLHNQPRAVESAPTQSPARRSNIWIIASTALIAIAGTIAIVFAMS
jgi:hypothetical protein